MITYESPCASDLAVRFLWSDSGRATVHNTLARRGLPRALADDLTQNVLQGVWAAATRGEVIDNIEAFVTTLLHRSAVDIVRGRSRSPQMIAFAEGLDPHVEGRGRSVDVSSFDVEAEALAGESLAAMRRAIQHSLATNPMAGAASLAYLTAAVDGAPVGPDCPQPDGGATFDGAEWTALWYAGYRTCFPSHTDAAAATVRKRRSRHAQRFRSHLRDVAAAVGLGRGSRNRV